MNKKYLEQALRIANRLDSVRTDMKSRKANLEGVLHDAALVIRTLASTLDLMEARKVARPECVSMSRDDAKALLARVDK